MKRWQVWKHRWAKANGPDASETERRETETRSQRSLSRLSWLEYEVEYLRRKRQ